MKYRAWGRLDPEVKPLIVELANDQNFKCAFCSKDHDLIIEHDHEQGDPWDMIEDDHDPDKYTIYNVRGLVCKTCNSHLWFYETDNGWDHVSSKINRDEYDSYIYAYDCRVRRLHEDFLELICPNYWSRRLLIDNFDRWKDGLGDYPWYWGFEEIKEQRYGKIRTPKHFCRTLLACMKFVEEEAKKDPNYQPPDQFITLLFRVKLLLDEIQPIVEARLKDHARISV